MSIQLITSELVKTAIAQELLIIAPTVTVYKEAQSTPVFPNFFINQLSLSKIEERKNYYNLSYLMNIRYRVVSDVSTELKLEQKLDNMSLKLLEGFNTITLGNSLIRCEDCTCEKVDGVLHFNCSVTIPSKVIKTELDNKMANLTVGVNV